MRNIVYLRNKPFGEPKETSIVRYGFEDISVLNENEMVGSVSTKCFQKETEYIFDSDDITKVISYSGNDNALKVRAWAVKNLLK